MNPEECLKEITSKGFIILEIDERKRKVYPTGINELMRKYSGKGITSVIAMKQETIASKG